MPVIVMEFEDEPHEHEAVIHNNRQRVKTNDVIAREYKKLKEIESERAKRREGGRPSKKPVENLPPVSEGKARDLAAKKLGVSGRTAEKAANFPWLGGFPPSFSLYRAQPPAHGACSIMDETLENIGEYEGSGDLIPTRDTWGTEEPPEHTTPEVRLWRSVLQRALDDLRHPLEQAKVEQWFMTDDYIEVCSLAGIDPDAFIKYALNIPCTKHVLNL